MVSEQKERALEVIEAIRDALRKTDPDSQERKDTLEDYTRAKELESFADHHDFITRWKYRPDEIEALAAKYDAFMTAPEPEEEPEAPQEFQRAPDKELRILKLSLARIAQALEVETEQLPVLQKQPEGMIDSPRGWNRLALCCVIKAQENADRVRASESKEE